MGVRGFMPLTTKATLKELGIKGLKLTSVYRKLARLMIKQAYSLIRTRRKLEKNPKGHNYNTRSTQNEPLHGMAGTVAIRESKQKIKQLQREQNKKWIG